MFFSPDTMFNQWQSLKPIDGTATWLWNSPETGILPIFKLAFTVTLVSSHILSPALRFYVQTAEKYMEDYREALHSLLLSACLPSLVCVCFESSGLPLWCSPPEKSALALRSHSPKVARRSWPLGAPHSQWLRRWAYESSHSPSQSRDKFLSVVPIPGCPLGSI